MSGEKYHLRNPVHQRPRVNSTSTFTDRPPIPNSTAKRILRQQSDIPVSQANNTFSAGGGIGNMTYEQREKLREIFDTLDRTGRGFIPLDKLGDVMGVLGLGRPPADKLQMWISQLDHNATGKLDYDRLEHFISLRYDEADQEQELLNAFRLFKPDARDIESARITFEDLQRVSAHLGEHIPDDELREMIEIADIDGTNSVGFSDFIRVMRKTGLF